jgi:transposase
VIERVVALTAQDPPGETTHWTAGMMAKTIGISVPSVQRIWQAHGLQVRRFKLSKDPEFVPKLRAIVGLYVNPPAHAIVLSVDEKSQIQALDRTQPGQPIKKGRAGTMTHDYKRHGTTTLFAALNILEGKVIGHCMQRHRHQEFIRFLNAVEAVFHFTPKSCSWLNAVETLFSRLTRRRLKRGVFRSIVDLQAAINRFLVETNADPKPFVWTAHPDRVIAAVQRGMQALNRCTRSTTIRARVTCRVPGRR